MNYMPLMFVAGPCSFEDLDSTKDLLNDIQRIAEQVGVPTVLKLSYDKANRTSLHSYRGPGPNVKERINVLNTLLKEYPYEQLFLVDVHDPSHLDLLALDHINILQIPAFLCRQTDLLISAGSTKKIINIKKGQFIPAHAMKHAVDKAWYGGACNVWITERGTCFGGNGDLVVDFRSLDIIKEMNVPYFFDMSHSSQVIGSNTGISGGSRKHQMTLARAAVSNGIAGVYAEVHQNPLHALSDKQTQIPLDEFGGIMAELKRLDEFVKKPNQ